MAASIRINRRDFARLRTGDLIRDGDIRPTATATAIRSHGAAIRAVDMMRAG